MKRLVFILCIITFLVLSGGCKTVAVTPADELLQGLWTYSSQNGIGAKLSFDVDNNTAEFIISSEDSDTVKICGTFAVDSTALYITSTELCKTFEFGYDVYKDRLVLTYNGIELTFDSDK